MVDVSGISKCIIYIQRYVMEEEENMKDDKINEFNLFSLQVYQLCQNMCITFQWT